ncbi:hypothetical protein Bca52824_001758 [Brassica carinata]|uniref:DUF4283 domain-containing protein n=1 Tax=Brassica carinata TaxID=52824 RepID=A0A8X8BDN7_BRACI|nr:hypothetical protein Bca52824_001758 [Brassica carinata]
MSLQSNLIRRGATSSASRRLDLAKEDEIIRIPDCDLSVATERFKKTLIGRVLHIGGRSVDAMIGFLPRARIWNVEGRVRGVNLGNGRFQFDFDKEEDLIMVLNKRPCHFNHWIFALERWEPFTSENFPNTIPFWIKVTGVPVHYWNDMTFEEIAKALGKKVTIDAKNDRIQVSVDADQPLQFERRVGFPNGDIGKVYLSYEGLDRYCYGCNRISHDIYSCEEIPIEEREQRIKEYRDRNAAQQGLIGHPTNPRNYGEKNKRPRSPTAETYQRSPNNANFPGNSRGEKRTKASETYWTFRSLRDNDKARKGSDGRRDEKQERYTQIQSHQKEDVWSRLDNHSRKRAEFVSRKEQRTQGRQQRDDAYYPRNRKVQTSQKSQQVWRPRSQTIEEKSNDLSRTATNSKLVRNLSPEKADSQQTISGAYPERNRNGGQGNGVLVVHQNETDEERMRRLKGKAHKTAESPEKTLPSAVLLRDRGTVSRKDGPSLDLDKLMRSEQIENMVMTREEESEVDKLVDEFGGVVMDGNMIQNDDLLVDEPGFDAEIIDAISQLSPANAVVCNKHGEDNQDDREKRDRVERSAQAHIQNSPAQTKKKTIGRDRNIQAGRQSRNASGTELKRQVPRSPEIKGARASKKLNAIRGKPSPKTQRGPGTSLKPDSQYVPRFEVYPSAKSLTSIAVSGSVGSQKPPSKKI